MKTRIFASFLCTLLLAATGIFANEAPPADADRSVQPPIAHSHGRMLARLLEMDDTELASLRGTIEKIEAMSPEQKKVLRQRIRRLETMDPHRVEAMRKKLDDMPEDQREAMRRRWMEMTPEERHEWRQKHRERRPD